MWFLQSVKTSVLKENLFAQDCHRTGYSCRIDVDARKLVCNGDLVSDVMHDEKPVSGTDNGTGTGCRIQMILGDWVGYDINECGRFSISSWLIAALPQKLK